MNQNKKNIILDCFRKPSENLKNFIIKYELWWYHKSIENFRGNPVLDENNLLKSLSSLIMKEKKDNEYFFCSSFGHAGQEVNDKEFFYGNKNEVKDKITSYLLKRNKYEGALTFFAVYNFVDDYESGIGYGSNLVKGKIEYDVGIE